MSTETTVPITLTALRCTLAALASGTTQTQRDMAAGLLCREIPAEHFTDGELPRPVLSDFVSVEPAANTIVAHEGPPCSYTVWQRGICAQIGEVRYCWGFPPKGETFEHDGKFLTVRHVHRVTDLVARVTVDTTPGYGPNGEGF